MNLEGACAVVTGASSGIGEATATLLAARGVHVVLIARDHVRLGSRVNAPSTIN